MADPAADPVGAFLAMLKQTYGSQTPTPAAVVPKPKPTPPPKKPKPMATAAPTAPVAAPAAAPSGDAAALNGLQGMDPEVLLKLLQMRQGFSQGAAPVTEAFQATPLGTISPK